jgi:hypothetical protein
MYIRKIRKATGGDKWNTKWVTRVDEDICGVGDTTQDAGH